MDARRYPYGMSDAQQDRFGHLSDRLRRLGYWIASEPHEGQEDGWLDGVAENLRRIEAKLEDVNRAFKCRGASEQARYYLHTSPRFDPGFGMAITQEQREATARWQRKLDRGVARWNAAFGE